MAIVKPLRAVRYNTEKVELSRAISPPYDIITGPKQEELHERSPYNLTHLDFRKDIPGEDKYARAGALLRSWLAERVLVRDEKPAVYFYRQQYTIKGELKRRFGFFGLLKLENAGSGVHGHEHTHAAAKEDRSRLIKEVKANLSPIFVVFEDKMRLMEQTLKPYAQCHEPLMDVIDDERVQHTVWSIDEPQIVDKVGAKMKGEQIFIADGHHRYEVSCAYASERRAACGDKGVEFDSDFILAYFTNTYNNPGLTVLPIHRIVHFDTVPDWAGLESGLKECFSVEEVKHREEFQFFVQKAGQREHAIGMYGAGRCRLLRLKNIRWPDRIMADKSPEYRSLDVAILNTLVFKNVLGIDPQENAGAIRYTADADEAMAAADTDMKQVAFLMNPTRIEQIVKIALKGDKMPPKSTYFYPKVESGLVVYTFDEPQTC
jgi:uncharacterized protein (DUF1015 family)